MFINYADFGQIGGGHIEFRLATEVIKEVSVSGHLGTLLSTKSSPQRESIESKIGGAYQRMHC